MTLRRRLASAAIGLAGVITATACLPIPPVSASPPSGFRISIPSVQAINSKQPYNAYNSTGFGTNQGGYDCTLYYHEYTVTNGCGGAWVNIQVRGSSTTAVGQITAYADFSHTFGCVVKHHFTAKEVLTEKHLQLNAVHVGNYFAPDGETKAGPLMNFRDFVNFTPNYINCGSGVEGQLGLKVSNIAVTATSNQLPTKTSSFAGPWYSPPAAF